MATLETADHSPTGGRIDPSLIPTDGPVQRFPLCGQSVGERQDNRITK